MYLEIPLIFIVFLFFFITQRKEISTILHGKNGQKNIVHKSPSYFIWVKLAGGIIGLIWTYILSSILIDLLIMIGIISKLKPTFLGLTVLAVGNSLPDAYTTIILSKQGFALMGLTGAFAGQLFDLLIGFGIAILKKCVLEGTQPFSLFTKPMDNLLNILVIIISVAILLFTFFSGIYNNYSFGKWLKNGLFFFYLIFMASIMIIQIIQIIYN